MWFVETELIVPPEREESVIVRVRFQRAVSPGNRRTDFCGFKWGFKVCFSARVVMGEVDWAVSRGMAVGLTGAAGRFCFSRFTH